MLLVNPLVTLDFSAPTISSARYLARSTRFLRRLALVADPDLT